MGGISVGPSENLSSPNERAEAEAVTGEVDAQKANEDDTRRGLAGAESKPFSESEMEQGAASSHFRPGDSQAAPDEPNDMISGRRNAGRDDVSDAAIETEAPEE